MLPFDAETLHANLGQYNLAFWPASIVGLLLGLALIGLCLRPRAGAGRAGAAILVAAWTWTGIAYHLGHFATINFAAPIYGWAFLVQSALLAWTGLLRGSLRFESPSRTNRWASLAVLILAIPGLPLLEMLAGQHWPEIALFGTAPNPAALATVGFLLMAARPPRPLAIIPVLWALASGATAWELGLWQDLAAP
ncbi:MAG: hypothetical protein HOK81_00855, partial [Rhodospirillaceae bacterium]|nr:hypothetical protein [Rhodospirillaceae bacterium]